MKIRQRKGLVALIVITIMFLAAAAFIFNNTKKPAAFAADDVQYAITVAGSGSITGAVGNNKPENFTDGSGTLYSALRQEVIFTAENYYKFSVEIEWSGIASVRINGTTETPGHYEFNDITDLRIQTSGSGVSLIEITFTLTEIEYPISLVTKRIENFILSNDNTDAGGTIALNKSTVKLGDTVDISMLNEGTNQRFYDYALWNIKEGKYDDQKLSADSEIRITREFLDDYLLATDEIVVVGAFIKTYSVKISDYLDSAYSENFIEIIISNYLTKQNIELKSKTDIEDYFRNGPVNIDEGSYIKVSKKDIPYFEFIKFTTNNADFNGIINYLDSDHTITVQFKKTEYSLNVEGQDSLGKSIILGDGLTIGGLNGNGKFSLDDVITIELSNALLTDLIKQDYYDSYFSIKVGEFQSFINLSNITVTEVVLNGSMAKITVNAGFLEEYLNKSPGVMAIKIIANFSIKYGFSINLHDTNNLGNYTVSINGGNSLLCEGNYSPANPFNRDTIIKIVLQPSKYASYTLGGVYEIEQDGKTITIKLDYSNRNIVISFIPAKFKIEDKTDKFEGYDITVNNADGSLEKLSIGDVITISVGISHNSEIKKWIINGKDVLKEDLSKFDAEYTKGTLKIVVTEAWLNEFGYDIINEVKTGMKTSLLIMIIIPSAIVPVLILVLLLVLILNAKRKKFIKAELLDEKQAGYTYNPGSMISDLRDDTYNKVTDEEVKAEMKKRKGKAAEKSFEINDDDEEESFEINKNTELPSEINDDDDPKEDL